MEKINILFASRNNNEHDLVFNALSEQKNFIINTAKDEVNTIIKSEQLKPNVLIIDLQPAAIEELELAAIIHRKTPATSIILISDKEISINEAAGVNIKGLLHKKADINEIILAINTVIKDSFYISGLYLKNIKKDNSSENKLINLSLALSPAERNVILLLSKGYNYSEIAENINYSAGTIRNIVAKIKKKTKLRNRMQIVLFSMYYEIVNLELDDLFNSSEPNKNNN